MLTGNALTTLHSRLSIKKQLLKCSSHLYAAGGYGGGGGGVSVDLLCLSERKRAEMTVEENKHLFICTNIQIQKKERRETCRLCLKLY